MGRAADFDKKTRDELERRVNSRCSNPACRRTTSGPMAKKNGVNSIGEAAHICAASPNGKRYDPAMTEEERKSASNGIWLCATCHTLIDNDPELYPVELLRQWKQKAEAQALKRLNTPKPNTGKRDAIKRNKNDKRKLRAAFGILLIVVLMCGIISCNAERKSNYENHIVSAEFAFLNQDYIEAAEYYHCAEQTAYNDQTKLEALYHQGTCYMLHAIYKQDNTNYYLHTALNAYLSIIRNYNESDSQYYIDAVTDSCSAYNLLNYSAADQNWTGLIRWLEEKYQPENLDSLVDIPIELAVKVTKACAHYYDRASESEFKNQTLTDNYRKSMVYYGNAYRLSVMQNKSVFQNAYDGEEVLGFLKEYANRTMNYYHLGHVLYNMATMEQLEQNANEVIQLCEEALESGFVANGSYTYVELKTIVGKTYRILGMTDTEQMMSYMRKAYNTLMPLVTQQISPQYTTAPYPDAAFYVIQTFCCTDDDYEKIISLYRKAFAYEEERGRTERLIRVMNSVCAVCGTMIRMHELPDNFLEFARQTAEELENKWANELTPYDWEYIEAVKNAA